MTKAEVPTVTQHPYYPQWPSLVAHYAPNARPLPLNLGLFGALLAVPQIIAFLAGKRLRRKTGGRLAGHGKDDGKDVLVVGWFVLCMLNQSVVEWVSGSVRERECREACSRSCD